jgi:hypothetical protein
MRALPLSICVILVGAAMAAEPAPPEFTKKPAAAKKNGKVEITFAVDRGTDVAVAVLDAKGKVIRHLAAGVLGPKAPRPFKAGARSQSIEWDLRDDAGKPAVGGPFKVRVSLGMKPFFDRKMFNDPQRIMGLNGIAAGPGGELYTKGGGRDGGMGPHTDYRVFDRDGKYLRTIAPFPAGLKFEQVAGFGAFKTGENGKSKYVPRVHEMRSYCFYPASMSGPRLTQLAVDKEGRCFFLAGGRRSGHICVLDKNGAVPEGWSFKGKGIAGGNKKLRIGGGYLAMGSDHKRVYLSGIPKGRGKSLPAVMWTDARERGPLQTFCEKGLQDPMGVAADGEGHLLVADKGNGRVAVFAEKDGKPAGEFKVPDPEKVAVDSRTGAVYVLTFSKKSSTLFKFNNWKEHKEVAKLPLGGGGAGMGPFLAVSPSTGEDKAVVWVGSNGYRRYTLLRIPDLGGKFADAKENSPGGDHLVEDVFVDRLRDEVYVNLGPYYWRFKDGSDDAKRVPIKVGGNCGLTLRVCPLGNIYGHAWGTRFYRWDRDGKPLAFKQTGKNMLAIPSQMTYQLRGLHIDQLRGEIFLVQPNAKRKTGKGVNPDCFGSVVRVYDLEGRLKREPIRSCNFQSTIGPAVDAAGNIYLGEPSRPNSHELPAFFKGKLPPIKVEGKDRFNVPGAVFPYSWAYGSVMKFSSKGGSVPWGKVKSHKLYKPFKEEVPGATNPVMYSQSSGIRIKVTKSEGALWAHGEVFPLTSRVGCNCLASYFDTDYYGRSFYPDAGRSRVGVLDTNGNVICHFGSYGNRDAKGKGQYVPLAMGLAVAASDKYVYVGDLANHHLVRAKLTYAAEETCAVK